MLDTDIDIDIDSDTNMMTVKRFAILIPFAIMHGLVVAYGIRALAHTDDNETTLCKIYVWMSVIVGSLGCLRLLLWGCFPDNVQSNAQSDAMSGASGAIGAVLLCIGGVINYNDEDSCETTMWNNYVLATWWIYILTLPAVILIVYTATNLILATQKRNNMTQMPTHVTFQ